VPIRLVVVDDHDLFREGLVTLLRRDQSFEVVGEAREAREVYEVVERTQPDVVVVDLGLPGVNGVGVIRELLRRDRDRKALVLTMHTEEEFVVQAMQAGAAGYALKHQGQREIRDAIREVGEGRCYLAPRVARVVVDDWLRLQRGETGGGSLGLLSAREREVFDLLVRGYTNESAATQLSISVKTVETHRGHILKKLRVHSIVELVRFAARHNLVSDLDEKLPA
jgi:DNA-binding NarL/FixJ family response regulator